MTKNHNYQNTLLALLVDGNPRTRIFFLSMIFFGGIIIISPINPANAGIDMKLEIEDDGTFTGGDCSTIGNWNDTTRICKLSTDLMLGQFIVIESSEITLNCDGHIINGSGSQKNGISITSKVGVTIKNCNVTEFRNGIVFEFSNNNTLSGSTVMGNSDDGIELSQSDGNTLSDNIVNGNKDDGIQLYQSDGNTLSDNIVNGNEDDGIELNSSNPNTLIANNVNENENAGIKIYT